MTLPLDSPLRAAQTPFIREDAGTQLIFEWHSLATLAEMRLFPAFLRHALQDLPDSPRHVVEHSDLDPTL